MNNILLATEKGNNKAKELIRELIPLIQCKIGGYWVNISKEKENNDIRVFDLTSLYDNDCENIFFKKNDGIGLSKLNLEVFNKKGKEILHKSFNNTDIIIMNEIGFLESKADDFTTEVRKILNSRKVVIAVIKELDCSYINSIISREDIMLFKVTSENKQAVKKEVVNLLRSWGIKIEYNL